MPDKISISTVKNGPLVVLNLKKLTNSKDALYPLKSRAFALCRCGGSNSKPFCDGTHGKTGFTDEKDPDRVPRRLDDYVGKEITIHDDRGICSHAGYCTGELPKVFRMGEDPWVDPNAEPAGKIIETIRKCPSGALSYTINGVKHTDFHDKPELKVNKDMPYWVRGHINLNDPDDPEIEEHYALCRCGKSKNKPFCSGQHYYVNFRDNGMINPIRFNDDEKVAAVQHLSRSGESENSSMSTLKKFPGFDTLTFKGAQLYKMPLNENVEVNTKTVIGRTAKQPLEIGIPFYVSHMSFGAISKEAKLALAEGSRLVGTAMCSGEGGMLPESREAASKYIYELGTAEFSHNDDSIRKADAVELKLGQAVKPGLGGHLPARKVSEEIARVRGLDPDEDSVSPGRMAGVDSLEDLKRKVSHIREITGGKPVGIKLAAGQIEDDLEFALKAGPDFITFDCRGGATASAPKYIKDNVGIPPVFVIRRARKYLDKVGSKVTLCITGGFKTSADIAKGLALGADAVALATASLISIGCLQSLVCHTGACPVGITTQNKNLRKLMVHDEAVKGFVNFYTGTEEELKQFARSNGVDDVHKLHVSDLLTDDPSVAGFTDIESV